MAGQQWMAIHGHLGSAYGTEHPIDIALGSHRRFRSFAQSAKGAKPNRSAILHAVREQLQPIPLEQ